MSPHGSDRAVSDSFVRDDGVFRVRDLGRMAYAPAYGQQVAALERVLDSRERGQTFLGEILLVEHEPVITMSRRAQGGSHLLATRESLSSLGVALETTDRGGDITYHGPGQAVVYPILDLDRLGLGLHAYLRLLEGAMIDVCATHGIPCTRDAGATGVWTRRDGCAYAKVGAIGIRVRRWVSLHGLALNVSTNLDHFRLIVPCGLVDRPVTSLRQQMDGPPPEVSNAAWHLADRIIDRLGKFRLGDTSAFD